MKKDKKTEKIHSRQKWVQSTDFLRSLFFIIFLVLLIIAIFIIWKRYIGGADHSDVLLRTPSLQNQGLAAEGKREVNLQVELKSISDRLTILENSMVAQHQKATEIPQKLVAIELLKAVLEGSISLDTLKTFLQRNPEPWAQPLFAALCPIKGNVTFPQLKALLKRTAAPPSSLWENIKEKVKSLVYIQKVDGKNDSKLGNLKDIEKALRKQDIEKALEYYENLSPREKAQLASWKEAAETRLTLEVMAKKLLSELAEG